MNSYAYISTFHCTSTYCIDWFVLFQASQQARADQLEKCDAEIRHLKRELAASEVRRGCGWDALQ